MSRRRSPPRASVNAPIPGPTRADTCHREPDPLGQLVTQWNDLVAPRCSIIVRFGGDYHGPAVRTTGFAACSSYLAEQHPCVLQISGVEPLGEPAVDRGEQVAGLGGLALGVPEAGEAGGGAEFP